MEKVLFVLVTTTQIVTALNLMYHNKYEADAIYFSDSIPNAEHYGRKSEKLQIFKKNICMSTTSLKKIDFNEYSEIFVTNTFFLKKYRKQILEAGIKINIFDEGSMNYLTSFIEESYYFGNCYTVYLYEPTFANFYGDPRFNIKHIPKIESNNHALLEQLNQVFSVNTSKTINEYGNTLHIFFSQPLRHNLSRKAKLRKLLKLFQNRSRHEYALEKMGYIQEEIIESVSTRIPRMYRKFHPREIKFESSNTILCIDYPWELYLLNHPDIKVVQYSLFSSVLTASFMIGDSYNIKSFYLYPILVKELEKYNEVDSINEEVLEFFNRLVEQGKVIEVCSMEELERICQHEV